MNFDIAGIGSIADLAKLIIERIWPKSATELEKSQAQLMLQELIGKREDALLEVQKSIIVAELQQSDNFTKRARPSVVYVGLLFIFLIHVVFPIISWFSKEVLPPLSLPADFWWAWGSVVSIWAIGRSAEKYGISNKLVNTITGK